MLNNVGQTIGYLLICLIKNFRIQELVVAISTGSSSKAKKKKKSTVNKAGNYTQPAKRKRIFNRIKAGTKGGGAGQWSARKAQMLAKAYKAAGGGYKS